jgi:peroxiredoxin
MSMGPISIGDEAPNFDLTSTEDALLMLRDEIIQSAIVLYFFADPADADRTGRDLDSLNRHLDALGRLRCRVLGISPAKIDELKKLQAQRKLLFPLLHDDRDFSARYGVAAPEESKAAAPALVVVSRKQRVLWLANPVVAVEDAIPQLLKLVKDLPSPTASYSKKVINRFIDRWVN